MRYLLIGSVDNVGTTIGVTAWGEGVAIGLLQILLVDG